MAISAATASPVTGWRAFLSGIALLAPLSAFAGELLPYSPPQVVAATANSVPEEVYQRFASDVRNLSAVQRQQLGVTLEQSRATATREGDMSRERHYQRLLDILRATP